MTHPILIELPTPILTPRLILRPPMAGDGKAVHEATVESMTELKLWMRFAREESSVEKAEVNARIALSKFILREDLRMLFFDRNTGSLIGSTGLHHCNWDYRTFMIGYWVRTSCAGKGYVTEAAHALTRYAFDELKATRVEIRCNASNLKSRGIPERLGFELEAILKNEDTLAHPEITCRDHAYYARTSIEGLPALDVSWPSVMV